MQLNVSTTKYPTNQDVKINYVPKNSENKEKIVKTNYKTYLWHNKNK